MLLVSLILYLHGHPRPAPGSHDPSAPSTLNFAVPRRPGRVPRSSVVCLTVRSHGQGHKQRALDRGTRRFNLDAILAFLLQLLYSLLNLLHLLVHCLGLLLQRGQLLVLGHG